ncbi:sulfurtransferase [Paenibacillus rubinfantis]|uniref:sulfurtransferase n=1 Tax=Paenibacillus rubinfantis TaxID=1720296 RepID=UPI00073F56DD|nr:rhodanese-like domain-containing protein [Paenibacillus rubinfantis]
MEPIVSKRWLLARLYEPDLVIVDCRFELGRPEAGRAAYDAAHIPGAVFLDLEQDLSAPVTTHGGRHPLPAPDVLAVRPQLLAGVEDVRRALRDPGVLLVDSRAADRYAGLQEPLDIKAGHIPGAINRFWKQVLDDSGSWKSNGELREQLAPVIAALDEGREAIVYCGSGVSACPNVLALHQLGYPQVKLYAGSWSDWISYPENPIATGEE